MDRTSPQYEAAAVNTLDVAMRLSAEINVLAQLTFTELPHAWTVNMLKSGEEMGHILPLTEQIYQAVKKALRGNRNLVQWDAEERPEGAPAYILEWVQEDTQDGRQCGIVLRKSTPELERAAIRRAAKAVGL